MRPRPLIWEVWGGTSPISSKLSNFFITLFQASKWAPEKIENEQKRLQAQMEGTLKKEFQLEVQPGASSDGPTPKALFTVSLKDELNGSVICLMDGCAKINSAGARSISRTTKRPWSTQNFYRHVRAAHCSKEGPNAKRQKTLEEMTAEHARRLEEESEDGGLFDTVFDTTDDVVHVIHSATLSAGSSTNKSSLSTSG